MQVMRGTLRLLRTVQRIMLGSIVLSVVVEEVFAPGIRSVNPSLSYVFTTAAVSIVGVILVVRRTLVLRSAESLAARPDDALILNHWRSGYVATYALCEALALSGLILRFLGCSLAQSLLFNLGGFVLLLFFGPREPRVA